jgi:hypothetical protein
MERPGPFRNEYANLRFRGYLQTMSFHEAYFKLNGIRLEGDPLTVVVEDKEEEEDGEKEMEEEAEEDAEEEKKEEPPPQKRLRR